MLAADLNMHHALLSSDPRGDGEACLYRFSDRSLSESNKDTHK
jgi:hypothetical protein